MGRGCTSVSAHTLRASCETTPSTSKRRNGASYEGQCLIQEHRESGKETAKGDTNGVIKEGISVWHRTASVLSFFAICCQCIYALSVVWLYCPQLACRTAPRSWQTDRPNERVIRAIRCPTIKISRGAHWNGGIARFRSPYQGKEGAQALKAPIRSVKLERRFKFKTLFRFVLWGAT